MNKSLTGSRWLSTISELADRPLSYVVTGVAPKRRGINTYTRMFIDLFSKKSHSQSLN